MQRAKGPGSQSFVFASLLDRIDGQATEAAGLWREILSANLAAPPRRVCVISCQAPRRRQQVESSVDDIAHSQYHGISGGREEQTVEIFEQFNQRRVSARFGNSKHLLQDRAVMSRSVLPEISAYLFLRWTCVPSCKCDTISYPAVRDRAARLAEDASQMRCSSSLTEIMASGESAGAPSIRRQTLTELYTCASTAILGKGMFTHTASHPP
jgi:hypothetical protein